VGSSIAFVPPDTVAYFSPMRIALLPAALLAGGCSFAQLPMVDISVVEVGTDLLEVRLRPDADFDGLLAAITFTLRWDTAGNTHIAGVDQLAYGAPFCAFMTAPASNADGEIDDNGFRYYTINAFGNAVIPTGCEWTANNEVPFLQLPLTPGTACVNFQIVNDAFTGANNKDYFISLNAVDRTGSIYGPGALDQGDCTTGLATVDAYALPAVWPNPVTDLLQLNTGGNELLGWRLIDASGREAAAATTSGIPSATVDVSMLPAGAYGVELRTQEGVSRHHVVISR
jgi:hypothetical protein